MVNRAPDWTGSGAHRRTRSAHSFLAGRRNHRRTSQPNCLQEVRQFATCAGALGTLAYLFKCASCAHPYRGCDGAQGWRTPETAAPHRCGLGD